MKSLAMRRAAIVVTIAVLVAGGVSGQSARPVATLDDLLEELRALRAEARAMGAAGIRVQLLATRLGLQEQRIQIAAGRLIEAQQAAAAGMADYNARVTHLSRVEESMRDGTAAAARSGDLAKMLDQLREEVARSARLQEALRAREQELENTLSGEQNVWITVNSQLDALERALPAR